MSTPTYDSIAQLAHDLERCKALILRLDALASQLGRAATREEALLTLSLIQGEIREHIKEDLGEVRQPVVDANLPFVAEAAI